MLRVENLSKKYGSLKVLNDISFEILEGSIYGFLGQNGAGKTTTMSIIAGLIKQDSGSIRINGKGLIPLEIRKDIGYLPQSPSFYSYMTPLEYLSFLGQIGGLSKEEILKRTKYLLELLGLKEASRRKIKGFSGGMLQRMGIASALFNNPKLLILDEPTSALDPQGRLEVLSLIKKLNKEGITIFFSTHLLSDVERICDYITILHKGEILLSSSLKSLTERYILPIYDVELENESENIDIILKSINGVIKVVKDTNRLTIYTNELKSTRDLLEPLCKLCSNVTTFTRRKNTLEDIFLTLTKKGADKNEYL